MITVHHLENSRSQRVLWLLEELGVTYSVVRYSRDPRTLLAPPALRALHPLGKAPIVEWNGKILAETGYILETLCEGLTGGTRLLPEKGSDAYEMLRYWMHYAEGSAMPPLVMGLVFSRLPANAPALIRPIVKSIADKARSGFISPQIGAHLAFMDQALNASGWFAGPDFSLADIMMSFPVEAAASRADLSNSPNLKAFLQRIHERQAYKAALERGGPYAYA
ncbi:MAG: glutathione S-transferase [Asticcacaulis sp.]